MPFDCISLYQKQAAVEKINSYRLDVDRLTVFNCKMNKSIRKIFREFKRYWKHYVLQSLLAMCAVMAAIALLNIQKRPIIAASIGATAFIVFAMPKDITATSRNVIGGHLVGLLCGSLCALIPHSTFLASALVYSLAVGLATFIMVVINTEHPPAAGTALGIATTGFSLSASIGVIVCAAILSLIHHFAKPNLKDLV